MKYFKEGQEVWCFMNGKGFIVNTDTGDNSYPIKVQFGAGNYESYTMDGRFLDVSNHAVLSNKPIPEDWVIINEPIVEYVSFVEAMEAVVNGKKVRYKDWATESYAEFDYDYILKIFRGNISDKVSLTKKEIIGQWEILD